MVLNRRLRATAPVLAVLLTLFSFVPTVQALSWSQVQTVDFGSSSFGDDTPENILQLPNNMVYATHRDAGSSSVKGIKCDMGQSSNPCGASPAPSTIGTCATDCHNDVQRVGSSDDLVSCFQASTTQNSFSRSNNGGLTWSTQVVVHTGGANVPGCGIGATSDFGTLALLAFDNAPTPDAAYLYVSSNGGVTWGSQVTVRSAAISTDSYGRVMHLTGQTWVAVYHDNSNVFSCRTTDLASFTCVTVAAGTDFDAHKGSDDQLHMVIQSGTNINYYTSSDGLTWFGASITTSSEASRPPGISEAEDGVEAITYMTTTTTVAAVNFWNVGTASSSDFETVGVSHAANMVKTIVTTGGLAVLWAAEAGDEGSLVVASYSSPNVDAAATAAFTSLVGFDVDPLANVVIVRTNGGDNVRTRSAITLTGGGDATTGCTRVDGVMAAYDGGLVAFIDCQTPPTATHLQIKTPTLATPTADDFNDCDFCSGEVGLAGFTSDGATRGEIHQIRDFPINFSHNKPFAPFGFGRRQVAWAWNGITGGDVGKIGMDMFTNKKSDADARESSTVQFSVDSTTQICTGLEGGDYYVAAVEDVSQTKVYPFVFTEGGPLDGNPLDGSWGSPTVMATQFGSGGGVACGQTNIIVQNPAGVYVLDRDTGSLVRQFAATFSDNRAVAISERFTHPVAGGVTQLVAYLSGDTVRISYVGNGTEVATVTQPSGTWRGMAMDRFAQNLWIATSTQVLRYDIHDRTTSIPVSPQGSQPPATTAAGDGLFGGAGAAIAPGLGTSTFGGNLFLGTVLIGMTATGVGTYTRKGWGWAMGALVGVLLAWAFGFFSNAVIFTLVVLGGLILWFLMRNGGE